MAKKKKESGLKHKVAKHVRRDIKDFEHEISEDRELLHSLGKRRKSPPKTSKKKGKKDPKPKATRSPKIKKVMDEWKEGKLHSGSKKGPVVTNQKQAVAIALSEARKAKKKRK